WRNMGKRRVYIIICGAHKWQEHHVCCPIPFMLRFANNNWHYFFFTYFSITRGEPYQWLDVLVDCLNHPHILLELFCFVLLIYDTTSFFVLPENREQLIVLYSLICLMFHLHSLYLLTHFYPTID
ncbi:hypothetical protein ACJX0J_017084, partial [Zea mays]